MLTPIAKNSPEKDVQRFNLKYWCEFYLCVLNQWWLKHLRFFFLFVCFFVFSPSELENSSPGVLLTAILLKFQRQLGRLPQQKQKKKKRKKKKRKKNQTLREFSDRLCEGSQQHRFGGWCWSGTPRKGDTPKLTLSFLPAMMHVCLPTPNASMASKSLCLKGMAIPRAALIAF
jgi:hypothetical protein